MKPQIKFSIPIRVAIKGNRAWTLFILILLNTMLYYGWRV